MHIFDLIFYAIHKFPNIIYKTDNIFWIEYILDLFSNFNFIYSIFINKSNAIVSKFNKNKEKEENNYKINNEEKIYEIIDNTRKNNNYKDIIFIYGSSNLLNKLKEIKDVIIEKEQYNREYLYNLYENELMKKNHILLQKRLDDMNNEKTNLDLYIFGKLKLEIKESIESYSIKELYIEEKKLEKIAEILVDKLHLEKLIITLGADGMAMLDTKTDTELKIIPTAANEVYDVSGAGDTAIAAISSSLLSGATLEEAAWIGNCAAGVVVRKRGTALCSIQELRDYYGNFMKSLS